MFSLFVLLLYLAAIAFFIRKWGVAAPLKRFPYAWAIETCFHAAVGIAIMVLFPLYLAILLLVAIVVVEFLYVEGRI